MTQINGYKLTGELTTNNAGLCRWGFCTKDGREYFIKEFLSPVYPVEKGELSEKTIARKQGICEKFFLEKGAYYRVLNCCRTGNNVINHDFFRYGSKYYAVTDKVDSIGTSPALIAGLSPKNKMIFIRSLVYSMSRIHAAGIVHGDIRPENILIKKTAGSCLTGKIIDFDSGFLISNPPEEVQGDFIYMAPETYLRLDDEKITLDTKLDIFALGILLHQYWTGEMPQIGPDYRCVYEAALDGGVIKISTAIPAGLASVIGRMLSVNPALRPNAADIVKILKHDSDAAAASKSGAVNNGTEVKKTETFYVPGDLD